MSAVAASRPFDFYGALHLYAEELHGFLDRFPQYLKRGHLDELKQQCAGLVDKLPTKTDTTDVAIDQQLVPAWERLQLHLLAMQQALNSHSPRAYVLAQHAELARSYEQWRLNLQKRMKALGSSQRQQPKSLKPLISARTWFHMLMGVTAFVFYQFLLSRLGAMIVLGSLLAVFAALEIGRRIWPRFNDAILSSPMFKPIARPDEYFRVNSATWYLSALCLLTPFFSREALLSGVLILGFADPAAAWLGKKYGKTKLYQRKTWVGSAAFLVTGFVVTSLYLAAFATKLTPGTRLLAAALAALAGTLAELLSTRLDDNLTVPVAAVLTASLFI